MAYSITQMLRDNFSEEMVSRLHELFTEAKAAPEEKLPALEQTLREILTEENRRHRFFCRTSPGGRHHLVYADGGIYLFSARGIREILWSALLSEGDWSIRDVHWLEEEALVLFYLEDIVHSKLQKCLCSYEPGDCFLIQRPWKENPDSF